MTCPVHDRVPFYTDISTCLDPYHNRFRLFDRLLLRPLHANTFFLAECHCLRSTASTGTKSRHVTTSCTGDIGLPVHTGAGFCVQLFCHAAQSVWAHLRAHSDRCRILRSLQKRFGNALGSAKCSRTKFLVLQSSKMVQRPLGLADPALPPASVVNSTTSTRARRSRTPCGTIICWNSWTRLRNRGGV